LHRLIGMIRTPRATLTAAAGHRRWLDLALLILAISAACSAGFLMTRVGQLAALDQQVRQLESFGATVGDVTYEELRRVVPYRPLISAALIFIGWPILWLLIARILWWVGNRAAAEARSQPTFAEVLTVVVHASAIFAVRAVVSAPINYARESLGGATSLGLVMPAFGESTFPARLAGAVDMFVVWWVVLVAIGLSILYRTRTLSVARWLFSAYVSGAAALALTQALRGGM
jgi:cytochrome b561